MESPPEEIDSGLAVLRRLREGDAPALCAAVRESLEHLIPWLPWAHQEYGIDDARAFLGDARAGWDKGENFSYGLWLADGRLVGAIGLMDRAGPRAIEIGYWLHIAHTGRGHMTSAVHTLTQVALSMPDVDRVVIKHDAANAQSGGIPRRLGFVEVERVAAEVAAPAQTGVNVVWERRL